MITPINAKQKLPPSPAPYPNMCTQEPECTYTQKVRQIVVGSIQVRFKAVYQISSVCKRELCISQSHPKFLKVFSEVRKVSKEFWLFTVTKVIINYNAPKRLNSAIIQMVEDDAKMHYF